LRNPKDLEKVEKGISAALRKFGEIGASGAK